MQIAIALKSTLGEAVIRFGEVYQDAPQPRLDADVSDMTVHRTIEAVLLVEDDAGDAHFQYKPARLVGEAQFLQEPLGDFLGRLEPFRRLGALLPPYDEAIRDILNEVRLDEYDEGMLLWDDEFGGQHGLDTINSLALIRIAGRFGWTLAHAHWRLARLVPVGVTLAYPANAALPEELVYWHDLLVLTAYFDGQAPVISGTIDWAYLENAAVEIFDCATGEIKEKAVFLRNRLRIYAELFELDLPEEEPDVVG
jgi:hypothetical protein